MDSPQIFDSTSESQYELKKAEKSEYSSVCSTDDELNLQLSPQSDVSCPRNISRPSVKKSTINVAQEQQQQQQGDVIEQQPPMPRSILGFLERKIELNRANKANNNNNNQCAVPIKQQASVNQKEQQIISSTYFKLKEHEFVSEEDDDSDCERAASFSNMNGGQKNANQGNHQKSGQKKFVVYQIEAIEEKRKGNRIIGKESWTFSSRYSMLRELYESLKREISNFSSLNLPKFPGKKWFGNMDEEFLSERKRDLSIFFAALSKCKVAMQSKTIKELLSESREAADEEFAL